MHIDDSKALNEFLKDVLKEKCSADPSTLARYILALLKKRTEIGLKSFLLNKLQIFLTDQTSAFVEILLDTLNSKSYLSYSKNEEGSKEDGCTSNDPLPPVSTNKEETKKICKSFIERGFCLSGDACQESHDHPIVFNKVPSFLYSPASPAFPTKLSEEKSRSFVLSTTPNIEPLSQAIPEYNPEFPDMEYLGMPPSKKTKEDVPLPVSLKKKTSEQKSKDLSFSSVENALQNGNSKDTDLTRKQQFSSLYGKDANLKNIKPFQKKTTKKSLAFPVVVDKEKNKLNIMKTKLKQQEALIAACIAQQKSLLEKLMGVKNDCIDIKSKKLVKIQLYKLSSQTQKLQKTLRKEAENLKLLYLSDFCSKYDISKQFSHLDSDTCTSKIDGHSSNTVSDNANSQANSLAKENLDSTLLHENSPENHMLANSDQAAVLCSTSKYSSVDNIKHKLSDIPSDLCVDDEDEDYEEDSRARSWRR